MTVAVGGALVVEAGGMGLASGVRVGEGASGSAVVDPGCANGREIWCEALVDDIVNVLPEPGYKRTTHGVPSYNDLKSGMVSTYCREL